MVLNRVEAIRGVISVRRDEPDDGCDVVMGIAKRVMSGVADPQGEWGMAADLMAMWELVR
jgi:hypothetical protein